MSVKLIDLSKNYITGGARNEVLRGVSLEVAPGEVFMLTGANGAGKTTLLKILATLVLPSGGAAEVCGWDAARHPGRVRRCAGFVHEAEKSFYQVLSVRENLLFFGALHGITGRTFEKRCDGLLERFGLLPSARVPLRHCSSGAAQKLAIIRSLLPDPEVLLLDEFTQNLDSAARDGILSYLKDIVSSGRKKTCIMVTHHAGELRGIATRRGRLSGGKIEEER